MEKVKPQNETPEVCHGAASSPRRAYKFCVLWVDCWASWEVTLVPFSLFFFPSKKTAFYRWLTTCCFFVSFCRLLFRICFICLVFSLLRRSHTDGDREQSIAAQQILSIATYNNIWFLPIVPCLWCGCTVYSHVLIFANSWKREEALYIQCFHTTSPGTLHFSSIILSLIWFFFKI